MRTLAGGISNKGRYTTDKYNKITTKRNQSKSLLAAGVGPGLGFSRFIIDPEELAATYQSFLVLSSSFSVNPNK
jgi:hypothetical protein